MNVKIKKGINESIKKWNNESKNIENECKNQGMK